MSNDEAALLAAFDALDTACEGTDVKAIIDLFIDDAGATFWGSALEEEGLGPAGVRDLAAFIASASGSFRMDWHNRRVRVDGDVAWVNAVGTAEWDPGDGSVRRRSVAAPATSAATVKASTAST